MAMAISVGSDTWKWIATSLEDPACYACQLLGPVKFCPTFAGWNRWAGNVYVILSDPEAIGSQKSQIFQTIKQLL